ncbi:MazG nucleotide pyrophosphohydrolase domain-containing protein [Micromonospora sp. NPDC023956]|uniref:MazG nucleotide pyrophosphohydrolase domain-containing protein n=1 Tax=Micromonospora sp. NPDC023956 TaxID=3155722 RepID=UPI0034109A5C
MDLASLQRIAWDNKVRKGYNTTDVPLEFCMLQEKAAASFTAWRRGKEILGEELADVVLYVSSIAEMTGLDLQEAVRTKVAKNAARAT